MPYSFDFLNDPADATTTRRSFDPADLQRRVSRLLDSDGPRFRRLWNYYRNPLMPGSASSDSGSNRPYRLAQEWGLPSRITGLRTGSESITAQSIDGIARKEVVVENDIAWRIDTMIDYLFGKPLVIRSIAPDTDRRQQIERVLQQILTNHGGIVFLQQLALLGAVHGFVDVLVKYEPSSSAAADDLSRDGAAPSQRDLLDGVSVEVGPVSPPAEPATAQNEITDSPDQPPTIGSFDDVDLTRIARCIRLEIVEPARALPLLSPTDWRTVDAYAQVYRIARPAGAKRSRPSTRTGWLDRLFRTVAIENDDDITITEIITPTRWARFEDESLKTHGANSLGELPLVHIQNVAMPFEYAGQSDVEPLVPLQDELNIRLSDRAHRITMQSFKMYLGKGIENFGEMPVAPGRMWMTDNDNANVVEFGGDSSSPSEENHIREMREAMDKTSAVTPIAAGILKDRVGRLTSAVALRMTLLALLAKTERKRTTYGAGIERMCELALGWLDRAGLFQTTPDERRVALHWTSPLPDNELDRLSEAEAKLRIGVDRHTVLRELGYE